MKVIITEQQNDKLNSKIKMIVKKLGLKQSIELFGHNKIKEVYIDNPLSYLDQFNDLKPVEKNDFVYYVDKHNLPLFATRISSIDSGYGMVYINPGKIWSFFQVVMDNSESETRYIINNWLKNVYNLENFIPTTYNIPILVLIQWSQPVN